MEKEYIFYLGSQFENDQIGEFYSVKILNKIISIMEEGKVLLLKDLESIYPSLYDLFNQNFTVVSDKNFARIALGPSNNSLSFVHNDFKCIILVDENEIEKEEAPFLNRFEKHIVSFETLIEKDIRDRTNTTYLMIKDIIKLAYDISPKFKFDLEKQFVNCDKEELLGIAYTVKDKGANQIQDEILKKIVPTFSQDILVAAKASTFENKYPNVLNKIYEYYVKGEHSNFTNFIEKTDNYMNIVYTFSSILENIKILSRDEKNVIKNEKLNLVIKTESIFKISVSKLKSENNLDKELLNFDEKRDLNVCVIQFRPEDTSKMNSIKFYIENYIKENSNRKGLKKKIFIFMVHLYRIDREIKDNNNIIKNKIEFKNEEEKLKFKEMEEKEKKAKEKKIIQNQTLISHLSEFNQIFIDNINGLNVSIKDILEKTNKEVFEIKELIDLDKEIKENIYSSFSSIKYNFKNKIDNINNSDYQKNITQKIISNKKFQEKIKSIMEKQIINSNNIAFTLFKDPNGLKKDDIDFISGIKKLQLYTLKIILTKVIVKCERDNIFSYLMKEEENKNDLKNEFFDKYFELLELGEEKPSLEINSNDVQILLGINIPGSKPVLENIIQYVNTLKEDFYNNEDRIRNYDDDENKLEKNLRNYESKEQNLINKVVNEFKKYDIFKKYEELEKENNLNEEYINDIYQDYYILFLGNQFNDINYSQLFLVLNILKEKKYGENKENFIKDFSKTILWMEANSKNIYIILDMFNTIQKYKNDLFDIINRIIDEKKINLEVSKRSPEYKVKVNLALFLVFESILKSILDDAEFIINLNEVKYFDYIKTIKIILQNAMQIEVNLHIFSKQIFNLESFLQIIPLFTQDNHNKNKELKQLIELFNQESDIFAEEDFLNDENIEKLSQILDNEYNFLKKIIKNKEEYCQIILFFLNGKIKQIPNEEYRKKIIEYILNDNDLILKSSNVLRIILPLEIGPQLDDNEDELINNYLSFTQERNSFYEILEKQKDNKLFDEVLIYLFESYVNSYFDEIEKQYNDNDDIVIIEKTIKGLSLKYLDKSLTFIDMLLKENNNNEYLYPHLTFLMCVAYIRIYLTKLINIEMNKKKLQQAGNISEIVNTIIGPDKNNFRIVIKYFIMKLIRSNLNDYDEFQRYDFSKIQMEILFNDFNLDETIISNFDYSLLQIDNINIYREKNNRFKEIYNNEFQINANDFNELINNENSGFEIFFDITVNNILSNLNKKNYIEDKINVLTKFSTWILGIINGLNISQNAKEFLKIFYDIEKFTQSTSRYFGKISISNLEMIIFTYKILISCLMGKENNFYYNLLSNNMLNIINNSFIPGDEPNENIWINSLIDIEQFLLKTNDKYKGAYICSCGQWYDIDYCGLPTVESNCFNCNQKIGGTNYVPVDRENHYRIFRDENQQDSIVEWVNKNKWVDHHPKYHNFRYKTIKDLKRDVEKFIKEEHKGIKQVSQKFFIKNDKKIRNLNQISYRLLSLIFYSSLYFGQLLGFIKENEIKNLIPKDSKSLFDIMCKTYNFLENALKAKGINEIQIFLNYIYPKLSNILKNCPLINTIEIRLNLENKINEMIDDSINGYENYKEKYIKFNNELNQMNIHSLRCIIQETIDPLIYPHDKYPYFRYFMVPKYPNKSQLIEELQLIPQYQQKYPIITNYLNDNGQIEALQNIIKINPFINSMIETYTYKITRQQGKELKIKDELLKLNNDILSKQFKEFEEGWTNLMNFLQKKQKNNDIKSQYLLKYKSRPEMNIKYIKDSDSIAYVLNDDGEWSHGMYIAAAYEKFINWQNTFLNNIIENISQSGVLHYFKEQLEKEIYAQDATNSEIVSLNLNNENSIYNTFDEILSVFSKRIFIDLEGKINYKNYKNIKYDFDSIEEELGKIILPGKKLFKKDGQRFITYGFEGYRGGNSTIIKEFIEKYKQNPLEKEEKKILFNYTTKNKIDYNGLLFSLQLLIFYLKNENYQNTYLINDAIEKIPDYVKINDNCKEFFRENENFQLNILISIYEYFELLCYPQIVENVSDDYKKEIEREQIEKINEYFSQENNKLIKKILLASKVRKFISRFLSGKRGENEIKEDENLLYFIQVKEEFWEKEIFNNPKFDEEFENMVNAFDIKVNQSISFYNVLGGDKELLGDKNEFEDKDDNEEKDEEINEEEREVNILIPKKKKKKKYY